MKRGERIEGKVVRVDFPNKGRILDADGNEITVKNVLEGQTVALRVKKARKDHAEGVLLEVLSPSFMELPEPMCPHFMECGGCSYQTLSYEDQLDLKARQVRNLLVPVMGEATFDLASGGILPSPKQFSYRNKMEFSFGDAYKGGLLSLGMHKRGSFYDIVTTDQCRIIDADMQRILVETRSYFHELSASFYHKITHEGYLRHLLVRKAQKTGEILVDLVTSTDVSSLGSQTEGDILAEWSRRLQGIALDGTLVGVLHTRNDRTADVIENQGTEVLFGQDYFYEELLGLSFRITPFSFFQTNSLGAEVLYQVVRSYLLEEQPDALAGKTVYDLYCGTGTIAQILAPVAGKVIGVEIVEEAVASAVQNAKENGLDNCAFLAGDVLQVLDEIDEKPDVIVLDPPRDGIHPKALSKIIDYGVSTMIYISCKPTSLARDLSILLAAGYEVKRLCCCDMFPGVYHTEVVCLLSR